MGGTCCRIADGKRMQVLEAFINHTFQHFLSLLTLISQ